MRQGIKTTLLSAASLLTGVTIGAYLFSGTQRRPVLSFRKCGRRCFNAKELMGLLAAVGITKLSQLVPSPIFESDKSIVIKHPFPEKRVHYVIIPKRDIKNVADLTHADGAYLIDIFAIIQKLVREEHLRKYEVITNGPGKQSVSYLHFHLISE
jgi:histidine triad (HIT) family protein